MIKRTDLNMNSSINLESIQSILHKQPILENIINLEIHPEDNTSLQNSELDISNNTEFSMGSILNDPHNVNNSDIY